MRKHLEPWPFRVATAALLALAAAYAAAAAESERVVDLTILHTSDVHAHLADWDFFAGRPADQGLGVVGALVRSERQADPDLLLLDGGDSIQGSPVASLYNLARPAESNPVAVVMNALRYDGMAVGNHDFDFGQDVLDKFAREAAFPLLSANVVRGSGTPRFTPCVLREVKGVKVGILGLTTPGVPRWERPELIRDLRFEPAPATAARVVAELRRRGADVVVAVCHGGLHVHPKDLKAPDAWLSPTNTWVGLEDEGVAARDFVVELAERCPGIDVILSGHSHLRIPEATIHGVLVTQPSQWGRGVSRVRLAVAPGRGVIRKRGEFLSAAGVAPDPAIAALARPFHEAALAYVNTRIGTAEGAFPGGHAARRRDGPLADLVNAVQADMAARAGHPVDVSATAVFNDAGRFAPGPITLGDVYRLYPYDDTLVVLEVTGDVLRRALEHAAGYWAAFDPARPPAAGGHALVAEGAKDYHWDVYAGIEYRIDVSRPLGARVVELKLDGRDLAPERRLRLALNGYRASGGGGYAMFREGRVVWESSEAVRDALGDFVRMRGTLRPADFYRENWRLLPDSLPE